MRGEAGVHLAPTSSEAERQWAVRWLKDVSKDSDDPECWLHEHTDKEPCNHNCRPVKAGKLGPRGTAPGVARAGR